MMVLERGVVLLPESPLGTVCDEHSSQPHELALTRSIGITASHSLPYEFKAPVHAKFNKEEASNHWTISSKTLRQLMDHFGPGIELLNINTNEDNRVVNFTCFTEKVQK